MPTKWILAGLLLLATLLAIFPKTWLPGAQAIDPYDYCSQAAFLSESNQLLPQSDYLKEHLTFNTQPMLFRWMQAGVYKICGISEYTSTFITGGLGTALVLSLFLLGCFFFSPWVGFFSGLGLLLTPNFVTFSSLCLLDAPLIFFTGTALFFALLAMFRKQKLFYLLWGLCTGLAMLTKGPFGLLPIPVAMMAIVIAKKWKDLLSPFFWGVLLIPLAVIFTHDWLLSFNHSGITFFNYFWRTKGVEPNTDYFFYLRSLLKSYIPLLIPATLGFVYWKKRTTEQKQLMGIALGWIGIVLVSISLAESKKQGYYLLSIAPALALLVGVGIDSLLAEKWKQRAIYATGGILFIISLIFSTTTWPLYKYKVLKERPYNKQFYDLKGTITEALKKNTPVFYSDGLQMRLNFLFPSDYREGKMKRFYDIPVQSFMTQLSPVLLIIDKSYIFNSADTEKDMLLYQIRSDLRQFYIISETKNLILFSNYPRTVKQTLTPDT